MTIRLDATGINDWGATSTEYGDIWNDNNDSTYITIGYSDNPDARGELDVYAGLQIIGISVHFRASGHPPDDLSDMSSVPIVAEWDRNVGGSRELWFKGGDASGQLSNAINMNAPYNFTVPVDGVIRSYSSAVDNAVLSDNGWDVGQTGFDEIQPDLQIAGNQLYLWADGYYGTQPPFPTGTVRIYEAWMEVEQIEIPILGASGSPRARFGS